MTRASASQAARAAAEPGALPRHVAIIMDGNGRWAKARHLPRAAGHRKGAEAVRKTVTAAAEMGLEAITLYAFSSENWSRPEAEVSDLMGLLRYYLKSELNTLIKNGIRLKIIGDYSRLEPSLVDLIEDSCARAVSGGRTTLAIALNYGAKDEITRAVRAIAEEARAGGLSPASINSETIEARLYTHDLPPLDLLIRTSGEQRLSNFMLWQAAYAELLFVDTLWPDFDGEALRSAIDVYGRRHRRYGGL